jgi:putative two-component system response regulator
MKKKVDRCQAGLKKAYEKLKASHGEIKEAYQDMFVRLAITAEYRDPGIGGHVRRVSDYSSAIARSMGLSPEEILTIRYASMMHDMGKIGIPDRIIDKVTALTPAEHKEMNKHTLIGNRIFEGSKFPLVKASAQITLAHHEKYDGTGYPKGLKGKEIPLYGRIVSVADYFDAFVSERRYKTAQTFDAGIREIESKAGTFFDPEVVIAFLKVRDTIKEILNANIAIDDFVKSNAREG